MTHNLIPIPKEVIEDFSDFHKDYDVSLNVLFDYAAWHYYRRSMKETDIAKSLEYLIYAEYYQEKANQIWRDEL